MMRQAIHETGDGIGTGAVGETADQTRHRTGDRAEDIARRRRATGEAPLTTVPTTGTLFTALVTVFSTLPVLPALPVEPNRRRR